MAEVVSYRYTYTRIAWEGDTLASKIRKDIMIDRVLWDALMETAKECGTSASAILSEQAMLHPTVLAKVQAKTQGK